MPRSLLGRTLFLALLAVLVAQGLSSLSWLSHLCSSQREGLPTSSHNLAYSMAASVSYFRSLPLGYRPLVPGQLRSMGNMCFFISSNDRSPEIRTLPDTPNKQAVLEIVQDMSHQHLGKEVKLQTEFISPDELRLFSGALKLDELPCSWTHYAPTLEPVNPPVLVTQIRIGGSEWLYVASLMPTPYVSLEPEGLQPQQVLSAVFASPLLLLFTGLLMHWQSRPLKHLAHTICDLALGSPSAALGGHGTSELVEVARAFNAMHEHIDCYLSERGRLFSTISHDLHTPIARLRLRVELFEGERLQERFGRDLDELKLLVKGALQRVKDADIHENVKPVDLSLLLQHIAEPYLVDSRVEVIGCTVEPYPGKPLAFRRCIDNLLNSALKHGKRTRLGLEDGPEAVVLHIDNNGPDMPEQHLGQIFESRFRLSPRGQDYGLGLGVTRNIAHTHGDEVSLQDRREGGLRVSLHLPHLGLE